MKTFNERQKMDDLVLIAASKPALTSFDELVEASFDVAATAADLAGDAMRRTSDALMAQKKPRALCW